MKKVFLMMMLGIIMFSASAESDSGMVCDGDVCYFVPAQTDSSVVSDTPKKEIKESETPWENFKVHAMSVGYQEVQEFGTFLEHRGNETDSENAANNFFDFSEKSIIWIVLMILLGGLALNLTPCMLPMIPVNAIIITGMNLNERTQKRGRGAFLGAVYGLGITLAYGTLGVLSILFGMRMGFLTSSPIFYFVIAGVFIVLGLLMSGMLGLSLDFSRFTTVFGNLRGGRTTSVFILGVIGAVLSGACVAPIVASVLLLTAEQYAQGNTIAFIYPFVLGVGMGLPWIFIGAGISLLPKSGTWMLKLKYVFAIFIFGVAAYYAYEGIKLSQYEVPDETKKTTSTHIDYAASFTRAMKENKPILIEFGAAWCHNCTAMKKETLQDPSILEKLQNFVRVYVDATQTNDPDVERILTRYDVQGFPTYLILTPKK